MANCFGYTLLQQLLAHTENAQEYMLELGTVLVGILDKQTIKLKPIVIIDSLNFFQLILLGFFISDIIVKALNDMLWCFLPPSSGCLKMLVCDLSSKLMLFLKCGPPTRFDNKTT